VKRFLLVVLLVLTFVTSACNTVPPSSFRAHFNARGDLEVPSTGVYTNK